MRNANDRNNVPANMPIYRPIDHRYLDTRVTHRRWMAYPLRWQCHLGVKPPPMPAYQFSFTRWINERMSEEKNWQSRITYTRQSFVRIPYVRRSLFRKFVAFGVLLKVSIWKSLRSVCLSYIWYHIVITVMSSGILIYTKAILFFRHEHSTEYLTFLRHFGFFFHLVGVPYMYITICKINCSRE